MAEWYPGKFIEKIRGKKPLLRGLASPPVLVAGAWVDAEIDRLMEEKKREWRARGYSESLIRMAEDLARSWTSKMSEAFAPPEVREAVVRHIFPKSLEVADAWISKIGAAQLASLTV